MYDTRRAINYLTRLWSMRRGGRRTMSPGGDKKIGKSNILIIFQEGVRSRSVLEILLH